MRFGSKVSASDPSDGEAGDTGDEGVDEKAGEISGEGGGKGEHLRHG